MAAPLQVPVPRNWTVGEVATGAEMNSFRDGLNFALGPPHFKGSVTAGGSISAVTNIAWPVVEDNYGGWDSTNHWWVVPPGCGGLYEVCAQFKWNPAPSASPVIFIVGGSSNTTALARSHLANALLVNGGVGLTVLERFAAGDKISIQAANAGYTASSEGLDNNFVCITWKTV